ncbi:type II secretion system protein M [Sphingobium aquiterrae]|uniref:type II secretion system protein M n=1 Tax=Sphingobium aquiterrae TaxID=2038656 RepID=UPI00301AE70C
MTASFKSWWAERNPRERVLVAVAGLLLAIVILWLGVARPVESGIRSAVEAHDIALDRNAAIRSRVAVLKGVPRAPSGASLGPIDQFIGQSAGEAGFTLERNQPQGAGRVEIAIASARPRALFGWLAALEGQGLSVETLTVQPSPSGGTVSVQATLKAPGSEGAS